jgi:hypothetical protein
LRAFAVYDRTFPTRIPVVDAGNGTPVPALLFSVTSTIGVLASPLGQGPLLSAAALVPERNLVPDRAALEAWLLANRDSSGAGQPSKPVLVIVATSGGGIAAAYWTARCLARIEEKANQEHVDFRKRLCLVTGASGGMLGAGVYIARMSGLPEAGSHTTAQVAEDVGKDSLTPVVRQLLLADMPSALNPNRRNQDRGRVLENAWGTNTDQSSDVPFSHLADGERAGKLPSLLISPMLVEDGRFLLISNLDLDGLDGNEEFFKHFDKARKTFRLGTAIRMNATFPYVSPSVFLPTRPHRRVVDAGYLDNYGVRLACAWIDRHRSWLWKNTGGVVLVQIRAYPTKDLDAQSSFLEHVEEGWQGVWTPVEGVFSARKSAMKGYNDARVDEVCRWFNFDGEAPPFLHTIELECSESVPLGWYLTANDKAVLDHALEHEDIQTAMADLCRIIQQQPVPQQCR